MMLGLFFLLCTILVVTKAYDNGMLGQSPPMGWSTWCTDDICGLLDICTEREIMKRADAMVEQGMDKLGYKWLFLDDCWAAKERDEQGRLQGQPQQFPNGMKALADYVHSKGLYLSLYTCIGTQTCKKNRPGSYGNYEIDAQTFADWGVDMVKCDNCHNPQKNETQALFTQFSQALNATNREMLFALCEWGEDEVWNWGPQVSQMYRVQMDHLPFFNWPAKAAGVGFGQGTAQIIEWMAKIRPATFAGPSAWADPDFLMTLFDYLVDTMPYTESRTEFTFWALWSSPLLVATDVVNLSEEKRSILLNEEVLAVHKDPLYISGDRFIVDETTGAQAWQRPLSNGDIAVVIYNQDRAHEKKSQTVEFTFQQLRDIGLDAEASMRIRDLWAKEDLGVFKDKFSQNLGPHESQMYRLSKM